MRLMIKYYFYCETDFKNPFDNKNFFFIKDGFSKSVPLIFEIFSSFFLFIEF